MNNGNNDNVLKTNLYFVADKCFLVTLTGDVEDDMSHGIYWITFHMYVDKYHIASDKWYRALICLYWVQTHVINVLDETKMANLPFIIVNV